MLHSIYSLARYIKVSATSYALGICAAHKKNIKKKGLWAGERYSLYIADLTFLQPKKH